MRIDALPQSLSPGSPDQLRVIPVSRVLGHSGFRARRKREGLSCMRCPDAPFRRLTDNIGLLQHADGVVPLHADGYSVDDVARGLLVVCREPSPPQDRRSRRGR